MLGANQALPAKMAAVNLAPRPFASATACRRRRSSVACAAAVSLPVSKPTLIDVPVSNHGARVRWLRLWTVMNT